MTQDAVKVLVNNRTTTLIGSYDYEALIPYWSYYVPNAAFIMRYKPGWDGRIKLLKWNKVPSGLFWATKDKIEKDLDLEFVIVKNLIYPDLKDEGHVDSKREFQNECVGEMLRFSQGGGLILNATGSGKTYIAAMYSSRVQGPLLFVVDQLDLLWQAKKEIQSVLNEKVGFVGDQKFKPRRITIGTIQTMHRHRTNSKFKVWTENIQVIMIDEIHTMMNRRNFDVVSSILPRAVFGLTATLQLKRKDVRLRAYGLAGPVCYEYPIERGMKENYLSKGVIMRVRFKNEVAA